MIEPLDRRTFLIASAASGGAFVLAVCGCGRNPETKTAEPTQLAGWIEIAPDGRVTVLVNSTDIGQGAQTGLAQIVADELDADWRDVRVEMAPVADRYLVKDGGYYTGGSSSIRGQFDRFARAGATARAMLIAAAAKQWNVPPGDCTVASGKVLQGGKSLGFGALAGAAAAMPIPADVALKAAGERKFVGKPMARLDIPEKVDGRAIYGIDVKVPGMLVGTIMQCPYFGGRLKGVASAPALKIKGVRHVVTLESAVAVVADKFWAAKKGLDALSPEWIRPADSVASDDAMYAALAADIGAKDSQIVTLTPKDDAAAIARVDAAFAAAGRVVSAEYRTQLLAHAPIEPMNATAHVTDEACEIWAPMQDQGDMRDDLSRVLKLPKTAITLHTTKAGGGFGRRLQTDYGVLAAQVARKAGVPVKLIWTREEDFAHDFYRPASVAHVKAALNDDWTIAALDYTGATTNDVATGGFARNYRVAAAVVRVKNTKLQFPVGSWRSVDPSTTVFFIESLVDEIAHRAAIDPLDYRRRLLAGDARHLRVLDAAAEMADWGHAPAGRFQGVAFFNSAYWGTAVAQVIELSVEGENRIVVHGISCAIDPGLAVNPNAVEAQALGGITLGLSAALGECVTLKDGRAEQRNFDVYKVLRLAGEPDIRIRVLETAGVAVGGCGEPPVPPVAPALANAIFAATGKRIRTLPLSRSGFQV